MGIRLVSILGLGPGAEPPHYQLTRYELGKKVCSQSTPLVQAALLELEPEITSVLLLGTSAVSERWRDTGLLRRYIERDFAFRSIPDGSSSDERWEIFEAFVAALSPDPIEGLESEEPEAIIFDVTHGFRLQPMLGLSALSFVRSSAHRRRDTSTPVRVTYGAFDARDKEQNITPIWDLSELIQAGEWNSAFDALLRYGRADELFNVTQRLAKSKSYPVETSKAFERLGKRARAFADDLILSRTSNLFRHSAKNLYDAINDEALDAIFNKRQMLLEPFGLLQKRLEKLFSDTVVSKEGLRAQAALARELFETGHFASTAANLREALVDLAGHLLGKGAALELREGVEPRESRKPIEDILNGHETQPEGVSQVLRLWSIFREIRNDILHSGRREKPREAAALRNQIKQALERFEGLVEGLE